ncbi:MAG: DUF2789 domain-containing protein [Halothiobacillaceae bacterium]
MEQPFHSFAELFAQLGLPNCEEEIERFIEDHAPLPHNMSLQDAPFWSPSQAAFLREAVAQDDDWAEVVDALNESLH